MLISMKMANERTQHRDGHAMATRPGQTPSAQAVRWWKKRVDGGRYVVSPRESPSAAVTRVLRHERLILEVAGRRVWILADPQRTNDRAVFLANFWSVVALTVEKYTPAAVDGIEAVRLHLEDFTVPVTLSALHRASASNYDLTLHEEFVLHLRPTLRKGAAITFVNGPSDARIPVLAPCDLLLTLDEPEVTAGIESLSAWLRHLVVRTPHLERAVERYPRPVVLQRLADIANEVGNTSLARMLDAAAAQVSARYSSPSRTGVGTRIIVSAALRAIPAGEGSPWEDEQRLRLERQTLDIAKVVRDIPTATTKAARRALLNQARRTKAYDTYHNTTLEGYRIPRSLSDAIVNGGPLPAGESEATIRAAMAVQGYARAFDLVLDLARRDGHVTRAVMLDLYEALFRPSVDAGFVGVGALRSWRTSNVSLRGWRHVPPNHRKLRDLLAGLEQYAARADVRRAVRAFVIHLEFVTIHPFLDGNGRLGRLLLNLELLRGGLPWVTVREDERTPFFRAIERAQVDGDSREYAKFLWLAVRNARREMAPFD